MMRVRCSRSCQCMRVSQRSSLSLLYPSISRSRALWNSKRPSSFASIWSRPRVRLSPDSRHPGRTVHSTRSANWRYLGCVVALEVRRRTLLCLDARRLDDRPPFLDLGLVEGSQPLRRLLVAWHNLITQVYKPLAGRRIGQSLHDRRVELADD